MAIIELKGENVLGKASRLKKMRKEAKEQTKGLGKGYASAGKAGTIFTCPERRAYQVLKGRRQHFDPLKARKKIKLSAANILRMPFEIADNTSRRRLIKKMKTEKEKKKAEANDRREAIGKEQEQM